MAWVKIDENFYDDPRWADAPCESIAVWLAAMAWCNRNQSTTGFIPEAKTRGLVNAKNASKTCADLVARGAFKKVIGGYVIRNYVEYQQPEKVQELSRKRSEVGKRGAAIRWGERARAAEHAEAPPPAEPPAEPIAIAMAIATPVASGFAINSECPEYRIPKTVASTSFSSSLAVVPALPDDDDFDIVTRIIAEAHIDARRREQPNRGIADPTAWTATDRRNTTREHGDIIRTRLAGGTHPVHIAGAILGSHTDARLAAITLGIPTPTEAAS